MAPRGALLLAAAFAVAAGYEITNTTNGPVYTTVRKTGANGEGVTIYRGIPFAAPPVGELRFRAPQPPTPWTEPRDVSDYGLICAQLKFDGDIFLGSEDCLYLQVYVPDSCISEPGGCPVFTWIYGGGYILGDNEEFGLYEGTSLATSQKMIVVAMNYRLGPFGFMALSTLQAEDPNASTGNAGLQDQVAALRWVNQNIGFFSGNPNRVTIAGESAGAFSVCWHMVSQASAGLFQQAIMESGTCDAPQFFQTLPDAIEFNSLYATAIGCPPNATTPTEQVACLRGLSTEHVMLSLLDMLNPNWPFVSSSAASSGNSWQAMGGAYEKAGLPRTAATNGLTALAPVMPWGPAIDGSKEGLLDVPLNLLQAGTFNKVPLVIGTNKNEGSILLPMFLVIVHGITFPLTYENVAEVLEHSFDMYPPEVVANLTNNVILPLYQPSAYPNNDIYALGTDVLTHCFFTSSTRRIARTLAAAGLPVHLYRFSYALTDIIGLLLGDYHASELEYVWGNDLALIWNDNDRIVSSAFATYWGNFVKYGDPNGPGGANNGTGPIGWPRYSLQADGETNVEIALPFTVTTDLDAELLDAWDVFFGSLANLPHASRRATRRLREAMRL